MQAQRPAALWRQLLLAPASRFTWTQASAYMLTLVTSVFGLGNVSVFGFNQNSS
jgi:hypothetical protein